jgi:hypothetical protein
MKNKIVETLFILADVFEKKISEEMAQIYFRALVKYPEDEVCRVLEKCATNCKSFPLLVDILSMLNPALEPRDEGVETANMIWKCIGKFGYTNPEAAKKYMGTLAWETVQHLGGWQDVCKINNDDRNHFIPQVRDLVIALNKRAKIRCEFGSLPSKDDSQSHFQILK